MKDWTDVPLLAPHLLHERKDADTARLHIYRQRTTEAKESILRARYGDQHLNLVQVAVASQYQRRGVGKAMVNWGIERAREQQVPITLFATCTMMPWYESQGFKALDSVFIQAEDEDDHVVLAIMYKESTDGSE